MITKLSPEMIQLAHRAVEAMSSREKEDIVEWARRLAQDITGADD